MGLIKPRLRCPSGKGQPVHLHEAALMVRHARSELGLCSPGFVGILAREGVRRGALGQCLHERPQLRYRGVALRGSRLDRARHVTRRGASGMVIIELRPYESSKILAIHDMRGDAIGKLHVGVERSQHLVIVALAPKGHALPSAAV